MNKFWQAFILLLIWGAAATVAVFGIINLTPDGEAVVGTIIITMAAACIATFFVVIGEEVL